MRLIDAQTLKVSITRYCAKHAEHQKWRRLKDHTSELCRDICFGIDAEPTVEERKTGKWLITDAYPHNVHCSECYKRFAQTHWAVWEDGSLPRNFCPNCGARMETWKDTDE